MLMNQTESNVKFNNSAYSYHIENLSITKSIFPDSDLIHPSSNQKLHLPASNVKTAFVKIVPSR